MTEAAPPAPEIVAAMGAEGGLVAARFARGCRCFAVRADGAVAGYGWLSTGPEWIGEAAAEFRPGRGEAYVWNCVTLPEWRLRGVFRALLLGIVAAARAEGLERLWIGSVDGGADRGAVSAVVEAGFAPILVVTSRALSGWRIATARPAPAATAGAVKAGRRALRMRVFDRGAPRLH